MEKYKKTKDTLTREDEIALLCKIVEDGRLHRELNNRTWVVKERVVAWSQYKIGTMKHYQADVDQRILDFATEQAKIWSPAPAYVLDVFETNNGLFIGEVNILNAAGFYKANIGKLVSALEEAFG